MLNAKLCGRASSCRARPTRVVAVTAVVPLAAATQDEMSALIRRYERDLKVRTGDASHRRSLTRAARTELDSLRVRALQQMGL